VFLVLGVVLGGDKGACGGMEWVQLVGCHGTWHPWVKGRGQDSWVVDVVQFTVSGCVAIQKWQWGQQV